MGYTDSTRHCEITALGGCAWGLLERFDAEVCCQRVREAEGQYLAAGDVEDAHQIHKPWAIGKYVMSLDHTWLGRVIARFRSKYG